MENQTVKNMKLIILEMSNQIKRVGNYKAVKTLSNSYLVLLNQVNGKTLDDIGYIKELESHVKQLDILKEHLESQSIPNILSDGRYVDVNHIATTTEKLESSISCVNRLLINYIYPKHRKRIGIFGLGEFSARDKCLSLLADSGEKTFDFTDMPRYFNAITKSHEYISIDYRQDSHRGRRFDEIYIDSNLDLESISIVSMMVKDKNNIKYFN